MPMLWCPVPDTKHRRPVGCTVDLAVRSVCTIKLVSESVRAVVESLDVPLDDASQISRR
jgi:hypothetical protein